MEMDLKGHPHCSNLIQTLTFSLLVLLLLTSLFQVILYISESDHYKIQV